VIVAAVLLAPLACVRAWHGPAPGGDSAPPVDLPAVDLPAIDNAGPSDEGAPDLGPASCPPPRLLCDGFEQPLPGAWSLEGNGSVTRIDATQGPVRSGGYAAKLAVPAGGGEKAAAMLFYPPALLTSGQVAIRAYLYVASSVSASNLSLMEVACGDPVVDKISLDAQYGKLALVNLLDGNGYLQASAEIPTGRWVCTELLVTIDGSDGSVAGRVDGVERARVSGVKTTCGGFDQATIQIWTDSQPGVELYVDDVVISTAPIGCE